MKYESISVSELIVSLTFNKTPHLGISKKTVYFGKIMHSRNQLRDFNQLGLKVRENARANLPSPCVFHILAFSL